MVAMQAGAGCAAGFADHCGGASRSRMATPGNAGIRSQLPASRWRAERAGGGGELAAPSRPEFDDHGAAARGDGHRLALDEGQPRCENDTREGSERHPGVSGRWREAGSGGGAAAGEQRAALLQPECTPRQARYSLITGQGLPTSAMPPSREFSQQPLAGGLLGLLPYKWRSAALGKLSGQTLGDALPPGGDEGGRRSAPDVTSGPPLGSPPLPHATWRTRANRSCEMRGPHGLSRRRWSVPRHRRIHRPSPNCLSSPGLRPPTRCSPIRLAGSLSRFENKHQSMAWAAVHPTFTAAERGPAAGTGGGAARAPGAAWALRAPEWGR